MANDLQCLLQIRTSKQNNTTHTQICYLIDDCRVATIDLVIMCGRTSEYPNSLRNIPLLLFPSDNFQSGFVVSQRMQVAIASVSSVLKKSTSGHLFVFLREMYKVVRWSILSTLLFVAL